MEPEQAAIRPPSRGRILSKEQAAKALGISRRTFDNWLAEKHLTAATDRADRRRRAVTQDLLHQLAADHDREVQLPSKQAMSSTDSAGSDTAGSATLTRLMRKVVRIETVSDVAQRGLRSLTQRLDAVQLAISAIVPRVDRAESDIGAVLRDQTRLLDCVIEVNTRLERVERMLAQAGQLRPDPIRASGEIAETSEKLRIVEAELKALTSRNAG